MSILRKRNKYATIANAALENEELSLRAKGLLVLLLSRPDTWDFRVDWIVKKSKEGREAVKAALKELEENGYLKRVAKKVEGGHFSGYEWFITDDPQEAPLQDHEGSHDGQPRNPAAGEPGRPETRPPDSWAAISKTDLTNPDFNKPFQNPLPITHYVGGGEEKEPKGQSVTTTPVLAPVEETAKTQVPKPVQSFSPLANTPLPSGALGGAASLPPEPTSTPALDYLKRRVPQHIWFARSDEFASAVYGRSEKWTAVVWGYCERYGHSRKSSMFLSLVLSDKPFPPDLQALLPDETPVIDTAAIARQVPKRKVDEDLPPIWELKGYEDLRP